MTTLPTRMLGQNGLEVTVVCLGTWPLGGGMGALNEKLAIKTVHAALDAGTNFIDTAEAYYTSESVLGKALQGRRDRVLLATKLSGEHSSQHIRCALENSLRHLCTDHIDLYQIHRPQSIVPIDETLQALDDLIRAGKVRYIGTSTFAAWQVLESLWVSKELGLNRFICEQQPYNILDRRVERELLPMAQSYGVGTIPWSPYLSASFSIAMPRRQALLTSVSEGPSSLDLRIKSAAACFPSPSVISSHSASNSCSST